MLSVSCALFCYHNCCILLLKQSIVFDACHESGWIFLEPMSFILFHCSWNPWNSFLHCHSNFEFHKVTWMRMFITRLSNQINWDILKLSIKIALVFGSWQIYTLNSNNLFVNISIWDDGQWAAEDHSLYAYYERWMNLFFYHFGQW